MSVTYDFAPRRLCRVQPPQTHTGRVLQSEADSVQFGEVTCSTLCSSKSLLCLGTNLGMLLVAPLQERDRAKLSVVGTHPGRVTSVAFYTNHHTRYLLSGGVDGTIKCWALQEHVSAGTGTCVQTLHGHDSAITCLVSVEGALLSGARDGKLLLWCPGPASSFLSSPQLKPIALIHQSSSWVRHLTHQPPVKVGQPSWVFAADDAGHVLQLTQQTKGPTYRRSGVSFTVLDLSADTPSPGTGAWSPRSGTSSRSVSPVSTAARPVTDQATAALGAATTAAAAAAAARGGGREGGVSSPMQQLSAGAHSAAGDTAMAAGGAAGAGTSSSHAGHQGVTGVTPSAPGGVVVLSQRASRVSWAGPEAALEGQSQTGMDGMLTGADSGPGDDVTCGGSSSSSSSSSSRRTTAISQQGSRFVSSGGTRASVPGDALVTSSPGVGCSSSGGVSGAGSCSGVSAGGDTQCQSDIEAAAAGGGGEGAAKTGSQQVSLAGSVSGMAGPVSSSSQAGVKPGGPSHPSSSSSTGYTLQRITAQGVTSVTRPGVESPEVSPTGVNSSSSSRRQQVDSMATGAEGAGRGPSSSSGGSGQSWSKLVVHHTRGLSCLHYDAHDQLLVVVSYDGHVRVYNLARRRLARDWTNPNHCLFTCAVYDRVKGQILTGDERGYLSIFSMEHGQCLLTIPATSAPLVALVPCLALGAATYALVSRQQVELWEVTQGLDHSFIGGGHTRAVLAIHTSSLWDLVDQEHLPDLRLLSAGLDGRVLRWDPYDMGVLGDSGTGDSEMTAMTFHPGWGITITGHEDGSIKLWNMDAGTHTILRGHTNTITCLSLAPLRKTGDLLLSASYDGLVCVWEVRHLHGDKPYLAARFRAHGVAVQPPAAPKSSGRRAGAAATAGGRVAAASRGGANGVSGMSHADVAGVVSQLPPSVWSRGVTAAGAAVTSSSVSPRSHYHHQQQQQQQQQQMDGPQCSPRAAANVQHLGSSSNSSSGGVTWGHQGHPTGDTSSAGGSSEQQQEAFGRRGRPVLSIVDKMRAKSIRQPVAAAAGLTNSQTCGQTPAAAETGRGIATGGGAAAGGNSRPGSGTQQFEFESPPVPLAAAAGRLSCAGNGRRASNTMSKQQHQQQQQQQKGPGGPSKVLFADPSHCSLHSGGSLVGGWKPWVIPAAAGAYAAHGGEQDTLAADQGSQAAAAGTSGTSHTSPRHQQRQQQLMEACLQDTRQAPPPQQQQEQQQQQVPLPVPGLEPEVTALLCDGVNGVIITGGNDATIRVWSAANTGELLVCHQGHTGPVTCLTLDANWLFSGSSDTTINCWDLLPACAKEAAFGLGSAAFAGPGLGGEDLDAEVEDVVSEGSGSGSNPSSPRSPRSASRSSSRVPSAALGRPRSTGSASSRPRSPLGAGRGSNLNGTSSNLNPGMTATMNSSSSSRPTSPRAGGTRGVTPGGMSDTLGVTSRSGTSSMRRPASRGKKAADFTAPFLTCKTITQPLQTLCGHHKTVTGVTMLPSPGLLLSCGMDGLVVVWDYVVAAPVWKHEVEGLQIRCMGVRPDNHHVLLGTEESHLVTIDLPRVLHTVKAKQQQAQHTAAVTDTAGQQQQQQHAVTHV